MRGVCDKCGTICEDSFFDMVKLLAQGPEHPPKKSVTSLGAINLCVPCWRILRDEMSRRRGAS